MHRRDEEHPTRSLLSRRLGALLMALVFAAGTTPLAAAQRIRTVAAPPEAPPSLELLRAYVQKLPIGSPVKVTPRTGKPVKGILMVVDDEAIVVKPRTRIPRPEQRFALADVDFVELEPRNGGSIAKAVGIGVASAAGAFLTLILVTVAVVDD